MEGNKDLQFDAYQFQNQHTGLSKLFRRYDKEDVVGMRVFTTKVRSHARPAWLENRGTLLAHLIPRIDNLPPYMDKQKTLLRWLKVLHLYFTIGASAQTIANETGMTRYSVESLLKRLRA